MPRDTPRANIIECRELGARVTLIDGLITDCGAEIARRKNDEGWFDMSTLKEPYRVEGKKTLGYELVEQLSWQLPDVILYPTGGGTGLVGMWKAFDEMETLGWIDSKRPRMFSVQASGCAPIVRAFEAGEKFAGEFPNAQTVASGLRVPKAIGDFLMLKILRDSNGGAIAIDDDQMILAKLEKPKVFSSRRKAQLVLPRSTNCAPPARSTLANGSSFSTPVPASNTSTASDLRFIAVCSHRSGGSFDPCSCLRLPMPLLRLRCQLVPPSWWYSESDCCAAKESARHRMSAAYTHADGDSPTKPLRPVAL
jgi:hypothetical protein